MSSPFFSPFFSPQLWCALHLLDGHPGGQHFVQLGGLLQTHPRERFTPGERALRCGAHLWYTYRASLTLSARPPRDALGSRRRRCASRVCAADGHGSDRPEAAGERRPRWPLPPPYPHPTPRCRRCSQRTRAARCHSSSRRSTVAEPPTGTRR